VVFKSKAEIALDLIADANRLGVPHRAVVADAEFGDNPHFLDSLEAMRETYAVDVRRDFRVCLRRAASDDGQRAETVIANLPARAWRIVRWREGSKGWLRGSFAAIRCWRLDSHGQRRIGWLVAERQLPDGSGQNKLHWCTLPASTPLARIVELLHRRAFIEPYYQEAKTLLGWDQYQGRLWQGFHRHTFLVMLAYSFLVCTEWRERQQVRLPGRPRGALSPSAGSTLQVAGLGASQDR